MGRGLVLILSVLEDSLGLTSTVWVIRLAATESWDQVYVFTHVRV